jgi:3-isopropylmalate/(R)-2-methylmalate dehydratase small subunit
MEPVRTVSGRAAAIRRANVDTDQIIPALWMKRVERTGYGDGLFANWRTDPHFVLNLDERVGVSIIVAGHNFGCGSSRQHAVWALRDFGIRVVISSSIADIHRTNLPVEGLVPVEVREDIVSRLMDATDADPSAIITVDVEERTLTCNAAGVENELFALDAASHYSLVNGFDPIDLTLQLEDKISAHEATRAPWLPVGVPVDRVENSGSTHESHP